jgi:hypothetical protein|tara:strand:+ start:422 stop:580 length:159 start_codon:yes stop_codon:yes gene_type:complete
MKVNDVLKLLEKHESECNRRYEKIEKTLDKLDVKVWGLAVLIVITPFLHKLI